jgi:HTH-type transcriptional regulator, sugar sensing transcriptional regulator
MEEVDVLKDMGLTGNEARIYIALLQYGSSTAGELMNRTGIHRRCIYDALNRLTEKGLVGYLILDNRKRFEAQDPGCLVTMLEKRQKDVLAMLPRLRDLYEGSEKQDIKVFRGRRGAQAIYEDILETGEDYYALGATGKIRQAIGPKTYDRYVEARAGKGIKLYTIYPESMRGTPMTKMMNAVVRYVPNEYSSPINTIIYGNKVEMLIWEYDPTSPLILLIENRKVNEAFKHYFQMAWGVAKP